MFVDHEPAAPRRSPRVCIRVGAVAGLLLACGTAFGQDTLPHSQEETAQRLRDLERQVQDLRKALEAPPRPKPAEPAPAAQPAEPPDDETTERLDEQEEKLDDLAGKLDELKFGTTKFLLTGFMSAGFMDPQRGDSSFDTGFTPVLLWKVSDNLLAAAAIEFELEDNETGVMLEYANLNWSVADWLTFRGGVLLHPLSTFQEQVHPTWINKLPDKPMFAREEGGLAPENTVGFEARGGFRTGIGKITYSAFVANGPSLIVDGDEAGRLDLRDYNDINDNKAVGGRIGYLPIPELEFFYAGMYNDVTPSDSGLADTKLFTHDFGVAYVADRDWLYGRIDARAEFVIADFRDEVDLGAGPFDNDRSGGYMQVAYRPTKAGGMLKNLEPVVRWDFLDQPGGAPMPADERRWTVGLNYWLNPKTVFKVAYQFDDINDPSEMSRSSDAFLFQGAMGF